ncbi:BTB/POZ/MATH-domain protein [Rhynchospora pubera]|uniref:BTB/POZ/MATH-domain protein n=1 Tax=Rhynchospora pubera TaxID=906938 RepID=A0AAV8HBT5_9POAL|nr:BTB/POZ/MATH-domain protein [Rhynchospora pubera]
MANMSMEVTCGTYQFRVEHSNTHGIPFSSPLFNLNGIDCKIVYFPQGYDNNGKTVGLMLKMNCMSEDVTASFTFVLLDKFGRFSSEACKRENMATFRKNCWDEHGFPWYMERSELEANFVRDGCFTLVCSVAILSASYNEVPKRFVNSILPFGIDDHFVQLLEKKEMADVSFDIDGEICTAHGSILAVRSPVFYGVLLGLMAEREMETIALKDIKPVVFKAMLHFIYTDSLPDMSDENIPLVTMIQDLCVASARYELDGLKILCEDRLLRDISMDTAVSILALAEELNLEAEGEVPHFHL